MQYQIRLSREILAFGAFLYLFGCLCLAWPGSVF